MEYCRLSLMFTLKYQKNFRMRHGCLLDSYIEQSEQGKNAASKYSDRKDAIVKKKSLQAMQQAANQYAQLFGLGIGFVPAMQVKTRRFCWNLMMMRLVLSVFLQKNAPIDCQKAC